MQTQCPTCAKLLNVPESAAGKRIKCPGCGAVFELAAPSSVTAVPAAAAAAPGPADERDYEDERPRRGRDEEDSSRRRRAAEEDDDRPRRRRDEDDRRRDRYDDDEDVPDLARRGAPRGLQGACSLVALFLLLGTVASVLYVVLSSIKSFMYWRAFENPGINFGPFQMRLGPTPGGAMATTLVLGLLLAAPCGVFMLIGWSKLRTMSGWGLALTAVIIAASLGGIWAIYGIIELVELADRMVTPFQIISMLSAAAASGLLLFPGIRGLILLVSDDAKVALGAGGRRSRRRRGRDDY